jgi:uncharacterized membrane-anchored protein
MSSILYILAAFTFGVIFGIFVRGIARIILSIILAVLFLVILSSLFNEKLSSIVAGIIGLATLVFTFLIKRVKSLSKVSK